ncbi:hypothetical protein [Archangium lansingense]|uniref:DUF2975 domain-containing protein n=1 Tax=Archangium lansingense TaxID=2995310 RepID=A0ABT4AGV2_9BACT|nr:hypothetical protein [Archangium lansinium]MCY1080124.1 hypothetical protein [Archangium lansinium]
MNPRVSPTPPLLPRRIRFAAAVCLVLSALTGFSALRETLELGHLGELRDEVSNLTRFSKDPDLIVAAHISEAQIAALEPMRDSRSVVLGALAVACSFAFVASGRLLRPGGLPLERMRRVIAGSAILAALLRTIDGAQWAVVARRIGPVMAEHLSTLPMFQQAEAAAQLKATLPGLAAAFTMVMTAVIAGTFALLGQYFRSEGVRQAISTQDGELAVEEED